MIKGFIKSKEVDEVLTAGFLSGENVVLYGPGGYGKSDMSLAFLKQNNVPDEEITIKSLSRSSTKDDLFGGINMKLLTEEGRIEYLLDYSIFATKYLILEEAFDCNKATLESIKDVLTSKQVRNGNQMYDIKTKFIIVCTNRSKAELQEDESSIALMERFPLSLKVYWDHHRLQDYIELIECVSGKKPNMELQSLIQYMLDSIVKDSSKRPPAPRTVIRMLNVYNNNGIPPLKYMDGLPNIDRAVEDHMVNFEINEKKQEFKTTIINLEKMKTKHGNSSTLQEIRAYHQLVKDLSKYGDWVDEADITNHQKNLMIT
jgi:hypothetical protein